MSITGARSQSWYSAIEAAIESLDFSESSERMRGVVREVGCAREDVSGVAAGSGVAAAAISPRLVVAKPSVLQF